MSQFAEAWTACRGDEPTEIRGVYHAAFDSVMRDVLCDEPGDLVARLWAGDVIVLQRAFTPKFCWRTINEVRQWAADKPVSFHKLLDGVPDFHRIIDRSVSDAYSVTSLRHGYYFFRWNLSLSPSTMAWITSRWRILKKLAGLNMTAYETNRSSDGVIDRLIFYHYPRGGGCLGTHIDPVNNHRIIMGTLLNKRGNGFSRGGIYAVGNDGEMFDLEYMLDTGDIVIAYPTVQHGVMPIDPAAEIDWINDGRWFMGFSSVDSDHVAERQTASRVEDR